MYKLINTKVLLIVLLPFLFWGCDDLFDEGDWEKSFEDDPQVEFKPLSQEVDDDAGATTVAVQLIGEQRDSDLQVDFSADGDAVEGEHYELATSSPVTIDAGTSSSDVEITLIEGSVEDEVALQLNLDGTNADVEPAPNLSEATVFIQEPEEEDEEE